MEPHERDERLEGRAGDGRPRRWVCRCSEPPALLATIEGNEANIKIRDRYYHIASREGSIQATCPLCGKQHTITFGAAS